MMRITVYSTTLPPCRGLPCLTAALLVAAVAFAPFVVGPRLHPARGVPDRDADEDDVDRREERLVGGRPVAEPVKAPDRSRDQQQHEDEPRMTPLHPLHPQPKFVARISRLAARRM